MSENNSGQVVQINQTVILGSAPLDPMVFDDLTPIEIPIRIGKDHYILREAGTGGATAYRNAKIRAAKMDDGKLTGFDKMFDADLILLSHCLYQTKPGEPGRIRYDEQGNPWTVSVKTLDTWLDRVTQPLITRLKAISPNLEEKETRETLNKQLENIQKKLAEMDAKEGKKDLDPENQGLTPEEQDLKN